MDIAGSYVVFGERLRHYALSLTHNPQEAEDIAQQTYLKAMERCEEFESFPPARAEGWLIMTARNLFIDRARARKRLSSMPQDEPGEECDLCAFVASDAINRLPPSLRDIARERYLTGLNSTQIGQIHSLPPSTVRARLRAAAAILKSELL